MREGGGNRVLKRESARTSRTREPPSFPRPRARAGLNVRGRGTLRWKLPQALLFLEALKRGKSTRQIARGRHARRGSFEFHDCLVQSRHTNHTETERDVRELSSGTASSQTAGIMGRIAAVSHGEDRAKDESSALTDCLVRRAVSNGRRGRRK